MSFPISRRRRESFVSSTVVTGPPPSPPPPPPPPAKAARSSGSDIQRTAFARIEIQPTHPGSSGLRADLRVHLCASSTTGLGRDETMADVAVAAPPPPQASTMGSSARGRESSPKTLIDASGSAGAVPVGASSRHAHEGPHDDEDDTWGLPPLADVGEPILAPGIRAISIDELLPILETYHALDTPSSVLFPWLHGIGDGPDGPDGMLERFLGNPPLNPPKYRGLCLLRAPDPPKGSSKPNSSRPRSDQQHSATTAAAPAAASSSQTSTPMPIAGAFTASSASSSKQRSDSADWTPSDDRDRAGSLSTQASFSSTSTASTEPSLLSLSGSPAHPYFTKQMYSRGAPHQSTESNVGSPASSISTLPSPHTECPPSAELEAHVGMHPERSKAAAPSSASAGPSSARIASLLKVTPEVPTSADPAAEDSTLRSPSVMARSRTPSPYPSRPGTPLKASGVFDDKMMQTVNAKLQPHSHLAQDVTEDMEVDDDDDDGDSDEASSGSGPDLPDNNSMLVNSLLADHVLKLQVDDEEDDAMQGAPSFRHPGLSMEVSLRNLRIQEIKYSTVSHLVLYDRHGLCDASRQWQNQHLAKLALQTRRAMDDIARERRETYNCTTQYQLFVIRESFDDVVTRHPELLQRYVDGQLHDTWNLQLKESIEARSLSGATEVADGFWLGNGWDDPFRVENTVLNEHGFDLVIESHDTADMPDESDLRKIKAALSHKSPEARHHMSGDHCLLKKRRHAPPLPPVFIECGSSSRSRACGNQEAEELAKKLIGLASTIHQVVEDKDCAKRDGSRGRARVMAFCDDGYTETSILALTYLMVSREMRLHEAYLHLQLVSNRSFFVYPFDVPFLQLVDRILAQSHGSRSPKSSRLSRRLPRWKFGGNQEHPGSDATWLSFLRFDGSMPSRVIDYVYLGNM